MAIKIPENFRGKPIKGAIERVLSKQSQPISQQQTPTNQPITPVTTQANINLVDYVQIPNSNILISKFESDKYKGLDWNETHKVLAKDGLFMPSPAIFMPYFKEVVEAYQRNNTLPDGEGTFIPFNDFEDIYKHLTEDYINDGAWSWLDAKFNNGKIKTSHRIVNGNLKGQSYDLESQVDEDCYVDLEFNKQGLPIKKSLTHDYSQGKNIYFWKPVNNRVARFGANSDWAGLDCNGSPVDCSDTLGVFACCEATQKNAGGNSQ